MHSFINNKTFNFMTSAIKIRLVFPLKLFVIWQQVKKSEMLLCTCLLYKPRGRLQKEQASFGIKLVFRY